MPRQLQKIEIEKGERPRNAKEDNGGRSLHVNNGGRSLHVKKVRTLLYYAFFLTQTHTTCLSLYTSIAVKFYLIFN